MHFWSEEEAAPRNKDRDGIARESEGNSNSFIGGENKIIKRANKEEVGED